MRYPKVSVVIPTKNSEQFLECCLLSINQCKHLYRGEVEVIVVDNFSTDDTLNIAKRYTDLVFQKGPERTAQANYGINKASGELIYLTGSDMTRDWLFIAEGAEKLRKYDAIRMSVRTDTLVTHYWGRVKAFERECYIGTTTESARFFRKPVWQKLGGFDETLIQMEEDFQARLDKAGYGSGWMESCEYHLHEERNPIETFKKFYYYGKFLRPYVKKHGSKKLFLRPELIKILSRPLLLPGFVAYKLVQYTAGALGSLKGRA